MADRRAIGILRHIGDASRAALPDAALLAWFAAERDEGAFAELVRRHGPMVLGVCRRVTRQQQDAEDAFQATFLILAAKAERLTRPEVLAGWLYRVAYRVARKARRAAARRRRREGQVAIMPNAMVLPPESTSELAACLDEELAALPERFRTAIVLCDLYELSRAAAAERLGIPEGTLSSRLNAGRKKLAARLARRGVTLPAAGLGVALGGSAGGVAPALAARTVTAVLGGVISSTVQQLTLTGGASMAKVMGWTVAACATIGLAAGVVSALPGEKSAKPKAEAKKPEPQSKATAGRPRMLHRMELRGMTAGEPIWSSDGKLLALPITQEPIPPAIAVYDAATLKPRAIVQMQSHPLGFLRDQSVLVTHRREAGQINTESRLEFWEIPKASKGALVDKPTDTTQLDPDDGRPFALLPDNQSVLCVAYRTVPEPPDKSIRNYSAFRIIDIKTGQSVREVIPPRRSDSLTYCASPDGKNLFLGDFEKGICRLECWAINTGKQVWKKEIAKFTDWKQLPEWYRRYRISVIASPDGKFIAANVPRKPLPVGPNSGFFSELCLFDAATGAEGVQLEGQPARSSNGLSFSSDGRLISGDIYTAELGRRLTIWDTKSGKILKSWQGNANAQFSPTRPIMAILEKIDESDGKKQITTSILGLWDVSPLLKAAPSK